MQEDIKILEELEKLKGDEALLILYCLLNRIPIIVSGNDPEIINEFISKLSELISFRKETIFGSMFNTQEEYLDFINEENTNYDSRRRIYISFLESTPFAIKTIKNFTSWIIGKEKRLDLRKIINQYLEVSIKENRVSINIVGLNIKNIAQNELSFEKKILNQLLEPEEVKNQQVYFDNFKALLIQSIKEDYLKVLADIQDEEEAIKLHVFKMYIQNFVSATKKIYLILSKIFFIDIKRENKEIEPPKLSKETLFDVINYHEASIQRILSFIQGEFFGFMEYVKGVEKVDFSKYVDVSIIGAKQDYLRRMGGF